MNLDLQHIPQWLHAAFWLILLLFWGAAIRYAPWRGLLARPSRQHAFYAATLSLALLWQLQTQWFAGLAVHPLALTAMTVVFGWALTFLGASAAQGILLALGGGSLGCFPEDTVIGIVIPVFVTACLIQVVKRSSSRNLFVFMLGIGFGGAILGLLASVLTLAGLLWVLGEHDLIDALANEALVLILLSYAEGFLNGVIVTALTVFWPDLVRHFDDRKYLGEEE